MAQVNAKLSKQMHVTPLQKGQVAIYKLIESDKDDLAVTDDKNRPRKRTPGYTLAGKKKIFDPFAGATVEIENRSSTQSIKDARGFEYTKTRPEPIRFTSQAPAISVRHEDPEIYEFMERIYENADNPFRPEHCKTKPVFYRVDPRKKVMKENEVREFKLKALKWVYEEATVTDLKVCAENAKKLRPSFNVKTDYTEAEASLAFEMLKRELGALAETDPVTIIKGCTNVPMKMRLQIKDCKRFYIIMFDETSRTWFHNDAKTTQICVVEAMKNAEDELLKFFEKDKDGGKHYTKMCETLKEFLTPR